MELINSVIFDIRKATGTEKSKSPLHLHEPSFLGTKAKEYLINCIETGWVSSAGEWIEKFENLICSTTNSKNAIAVSNGTDGLRLALYIAGVRANDEVLCPSLTFVATANSISHLGAIPHFVDVENKTFGIASNQLDQYLSENSYIKDGITHNKKTHRAIKAIVPVHLYGIPSEIKEIVEIARKWNIKIIRINPL